MLLNPIPCPLKGYTYSLGSFFIFGAIAVPADVTNFEQVKAIADRAIQQYGRLDTWVHLAAINLYATFEQTTPEEFKHIEALTPVNGYLAAASGSGL